MNRKILIGTAVTTAFMILQHDVHAFNSDRSTWREISSTVSHSFPATGASISTPNQTTMDSVSPLKENLTSSIAFASTPSTTTESTPTGFSAWSETITNLIIMTFLGGVIMKYLKLNSMVREIRTAAQEAIARRQQNRESDQHLWSANSSSSETITKMSGKPSNNNGSKEDSSIIFGTYKLELASRGSMDTYERSDIAPSVQIHGETSRTGNKEVYEDSQSLCSDFFTIDMHNTTERTFEYENTPKYLESSKKSCEEYLASRKNSRSLEGDNHLQVMQSDEAPTELCQSQAGLSRSCPTGLPDLADAKPSVASAKDLQK